MKTHTLVLIIAGAVVIVIAISVMLYMYFRPGNPKTRSDTTSSSPDVGAPAPPKVGVPAFFNQEEQERQIREELERRDREDQKSKDRKKQELQAWEEQQRLDLKELERLDLEKQELLDREEQERLDREEQELLDREEQELLERGEQERRNRQEQERRDREKSMWNSREYYTVQKTPEQIIDTWKEYRRTNFNVSKFRIKTTRVFATDEQLRDIRKLLNGGGDLAANQDKLLQLEATFVETQNTELQDLQYMFEKEKTTSLLKGYFPETLPQGYGFQRALPNLTPNFISWQNTEYNSDFNDGGIQIKNGSMYYQNTILENSKLTETLVKLYIEGLAPDFILSEKREQVRQLFAKLKSDNTLFSKLRWRERRTPLGFKTTDGYARNTRTRISFLKDEEIKDLQIMANSTEDPVLLQDNSSVYKLVTTSDYFNAEPRELILVEKTEVDDIISHMRSSPNFGVFRNKLHLLHKRALANFKSNNFKIDSALAGNLIIENGYLYAVQNQNERSRLILYSRYC
jgi:hypothetical protein